MKTKSLAELLTAGLDGGAAEVLRRIAAKEITPAQVEAECRAQVLPTLNERWERYRAGNLFRAQPWGFLTFLQARSEDTAADREIHKEIEGLLEAAGERKGVRGQEIWAFFCYRIMPSMADRQALLDNGQLRPVASLPPYEQKAFKRWQNEYNTATRTWRWADDTGAAYDERYKL